MTCGASTMTCSRKNGFGFACLVLVAPLFSISASASSLLAKPPYETTKIIVADETTDALTTGSVPPKTGEICSAGKVDIRQRSSKFDFSFALGASIGPAEEPAP